MAGAKTMPESVQSIVDLNKHPLNRAAQHVLANAGSPPSHRLPGVMALLVLAISELSEANELDDRLPILSHWASSQELQTAALARLNRVLTGDEILSGTARETAGQIATELG